MTDTAPPLPSPRLVGVPHDTWRAEQYDAYRRVLALHQSGGGKAMIEAPTGIGKSPIGAALGHHASVTVLVQNLSLVDQYAHGYGLKPLKGMRNYSCVHPEKTTIWLQKRWGEPTAADCHYERKYECPVAHLCPYLIAREEAIAAQKMVCTYPYYFHSERAKERPGVLVMDECHHSADSMLGFTELSVHASQALEYGLPEFPYSSYGYGPDGAGDMMSAQARGEVLDWADSAMDILAPLRTDLSREGAKARRLYDKLAILPVALEQGSWFMRSGPYAIQYAGQQGARPGLFLKALDASSIARHTWEHKQTVLFMSATIGNPKALATELGLSDSDYSFYSYPHPVPAQYRPILDLGFERMTAENLRLHPELYARQGMQIARLIRKEFRPEWRGLVLTSSNDKVRRLRALLYGQFGNRVYIPREGAGVMEKVQGFLRSRQRGLIAVDTVQGWGHGLDLYGDLGRFVVVAGVDDASPHDPFERARAARPGGRTYQWWQAASGTQQATGRAQRGERDDAGEWVVSYGVLADGKCTRPTALKLYSQYWREAIVRYG